MSKEPIISVSGLRGIIGETLNPVVASNYVAAFAAEVGPGDLIVSHDGRSTGPMMADVVTAALCAAGRNVHYADVAPTPTAGVLVRTHEAAGGVQISASHNPPEYNGIKLFGADGRVIGAATGQRVLQRYRQNAEHPFDAGWRKFSEVGEASVLGNVTDAHVNRILDTVDVEKIRGANFTVLLDSNHGSGATMGRRLLAELGCNITLLGEEANGQFAHLPEPTAKNLQGVCKHVIEANAVVGFCQDPDADRLAIIDENGNYIGEEYTVSIVIDNILQSMRGPIVTNCSTSRMTQDLCEKYDVPFWRSKVGEANVCDLMIEKGAIFGGEGSGGPIDPRVGFVRDSFVGMAQVLEAMAKTQKSISQLASEMPSYAIHKSACRVESDQIANCFDRLEQHFSDAETDRMDGLRLDWPNRWLLVRASNTEPIVRLIAESKSATDAENLCNEAAKAMNG